jgi:Methyltransferase domain
MLLSGFINRLLMPFDLAIARRSNLDQLRLGASTLNEPGPDAAGLDAALGGIEGLDLKIGKVHEESLRAQIALYWRLIDHQDSFKVMPEELQCELCKHTAPAILFKNFQSNCMFGGGRLVRHQCPACDVIFGPDKILTLTAEELTQEYNLHYSAYKEGESKEREIRAFNSLKPRKDGIYLNYGSGSWSSTVPTLRQEGWNVVAYEPHTAAATSDWCISDANELSKIKFDGIFTNNVLEHFRNPVLELEKISSYLKPGGKMAHATPCYDYLYEFTRFHIFFFLGRSRSFLIEKAGLKEEEFIVDGDFMNLILSRLDA